MSLIARFSSLFRPEQSTEVDVETGLGRKEELCARAFNYLGIPNNIWSMVLDSSSSFELAQFAATCSFLYKIVGVDFKRLCKSYNIFHLPEETYASAWSGSSHRLLGFSIFYALGHGKAAFYDKQFNVILIASLETAEKKVTSIHTRSCWSIGLFDEGRLLMYSDRPYKEMNVKFYLHDANNGSLLHVLNLQHLPVLHFFGVVAFDFDKAIFVFSCITQRAFHLPIEIPVVYIACGRTNDHVYYVFVTLQETVFYEHNFKKSVTIQNHFEGNPTFPEHMGSRAKVWGCVLAHSHSYVCGYGDSFRIYNMQTGEIQLEYEGKYVGEEEFSGRDSFYVANDLVVIGITQKQVFVYEAEAWKPFESVSPPTRNEIYREVFHSRHMEKVIWEVFSGRGQPGPEPQLGFNDFKDLIKDRYLDESHKLYRTVRDAFSYFFKSWYS